MTLIDKISEDLKVAMKSGDKLRLETLCTIKAGFLEKQVEKRHTMLSQNGCWVINTCNFTKTRAK